MVEPPKPFPTNNNRYNTKSSITDDSIGSGCIGFGSNDKSLLKLNSSKQNSINFAHHFIKNIYHVSLFLFFGFGNCSFYIFLLQYFCYKYGNGIFFDS